MKKYPGFEALLNFLPDRPQPWWIRYGATSLLIVMVFFVRAGVGQLTGPYGFVLFVLPVLAAAVVFDRGSGAFATLLALALISALLDWSGGWLVHAPALALCALIGFALAFAGEALRSVTEHAVIAEREKDLMYRELNHRIKNTFSIVQAILRLQRRSESEEVRNVLAASERRCNAIFHAHDHVSVDDRGGTTEMRAYLTTLGASLAVGLRDIRPIAINVDAEPVRLPSDKAESVGLIVNELVTNAFKYAFPNNQPGTVQISFGRRGTAWRLEVLDNGVGCPTEVKAGLGTTLMQMLAQQLKGRLTREDVRPGCKVSLEFPAE